MTSGLNCGSRQWKTMAVTGLGTAPSPVQAQAQTGDGAGWRTKVRTNFWNATCKKRSAGKAKARLGPIPWPTAAMVVVVVAVVAAATCSSTLSQLLGQRRCRHLLPKSPTSGPAVPRVLVLVVAATEATQEHRQQSHPRAKAVAGKPGSGWPEVTAALKCRLV